MSAAATRIGRRIKSRLRSRVFGRTTLALPLESPLWDFDFRTPVTQNFDASLLGTFDHEWQFQEETGDVEDQIGSADFSIVNSPLQNREAIGLWNGTSYVARKAIEVVGDGNTDGFSLASAGVFDPGSGSFAFKLSFRIARAVAALSNLVEKRDAVFGAGWELDLNTDGTLVFTCENAAGTTTSSIATGNHADGAWHTTLIVRDVTGGNQYIKSDLGSDSDATVAGDITSAVALKLLGAGQRGGPHAQITHAAGVLGANAEALGAADMTDFWKLGSDPTGLLTTQSRTSLITVPVSANRVSHFAINKLPIGWHSALNDGAGGLGLYCNNAVTNLLTDSELLSNWTQSGTSSTVDDQTDAPDGFKSASELTAGADNDLVSQTFTTAGGNTYTLSVWIKESTVGVTGRIIMTNAADAELGAQAFTATSEWQLVALTAATVAGSTSKFKIEIDTDTESVFAHGAQAALGTGRGAGIRTAGATASLIEGNYRSTDKVPTELARIEATWIYTRGRGGDQAVWSSEVLQDWRANYFDSNTDGFQNHFRDSSSLAWWTPEAGDPDIETLYVDITRWDITAGRIPEDATYTAARHINGVSTVTPSTSTSLVAETERDICFGRLFSAASALDGFIERLQIWDAPGAEPA